MSLATLLWSINVLLKTGKHKKVARTACIRKIVTALIIMLRDNKPWHSSFA